MSSLAVGIDVGKETLVTCSRSSDGLTVETISFPNNNSGIKKLIRKLRNNENVAILMESTGPYHWQAAKQLANAYENVRVVNPILSNRMIKQSVRKRKTDKVDAGHLAFMASEGYGYLFTETEDMAKNKALVRHYWKLKMTAHNLTRHENYLTSYRNQHLPSMAKAILKQCESLEKKIVQNFSKGNDLKYLDSIPGVSPIIASTILSELGDLKRFNKTKQLIAYAGLDPGVKQTGTKGNSYSKLSKRGSPVLRMVLFYAAFGCFQRPPFKKLYDDHKEKGIHHTAVLCILARKILRIAITLLKKREVFNEQYLTGHN